MRGAFAPQGQEEQRGKRGEQVFSESRHIVTLNFIRLFSRPAQEGPIETSILGLHEKVRRHTGMAGFHAVCRRRAQPPAAKGREGTKRYKREWSGKVPNRLAGRGENSFPVLCASTGKLYLNARKRLPLNMGERERI